ncbi:unnamed protein product [Dimorphilus gyrociliatus]|uniref:Apple domain-containing protein n=1 Tax=Dimorphilus gyrociliatus TaxID=2664684 RepID=A0A7I8VEG4_9ANNE|nr:unnamed protein product [Dimorphilus gyrociliatus]
MDKILYILSVLITLLLFKTGNASNNCVVSKRITYGSSTTPEVQCLAYGGCWDAEGCYIGNDYVAGFRTVKRICEVGLVISQHNNLSLQECGRRCLFNENCETFIYQFDITTCQLRDTICHQYSSSVEPSNYIRSYAKMAVKQWTEYPGNCAQNDIANTMENVNTCAISCKSQSTCKIFVAPRSTASNSACFMKDTVCDILDPGNARELSATTFLPGPIYSDLNDHSQSKLIHITDSELADTCVASTTEKDFNLRIPWPNLGDGNPDFRIVIKGKNMKNCMNIKYGLTMSGVLAYVGIDGQISPSFSGPFNACEYESGNNDTECIYKCTCGEDYCQAAYIRGFGSDDDNMEICFYNVLST